MEVESMVDPELSGTNKKNVRYLFRYFSLGESEDDWIFLKDLNGCRESVEDYQRRLGWDPPDWTGNSKKHEKGRGMWRRSGGCWERGVSPLSIEK
jgi:hypothetical protein